MCDGPTSECTTLYRDILRASPTFAMTHRPFGGDLVRVSWGALVGGQVYGGSTDVFLPDPRVFDAPRHWASVRRAVFDLLVQAHETVMAAARRRGLEHGPS